MSTIHEALRKAQTDRDERGGKPKTFSASRWPRRSLSARVAQGGAVVLGMVFLASGLLFWRSWNLPDARVRKVTPVIERRPVQKEVEEEPAPVTPVDLPRSPETRQAAETFYARAMEFQGSGDIEKAKRAYETALEADPGHVDTLNNLGVLHLGQGSHEEARKHFEKALRLRPDYVEALYNLACLHAANGEPDKALARLGRAISLDGRVEAWAREDADLRSLRDLPRFRALIGSQKETEQ